LQDIGLLALNAVAPEVTRTLTLDADGDHTQLQVSEKQYFGCDHATMGKWVAESWQLPEEFQYAIRGSHHPQGPDGCSTERQTLLHCVALSGRLADVWCHSDTEKAVHEAASAANDYLALSSEDVLAILRLIPVGFSEISGFFQAHVGTAEEIERPLQTATDLLLISAGNTVQS
ncbi:MAG: HDOD domain-containing protein, partial [Nitrospirales bacterium]